MSFLPWLDLRKVHIKFKYKIKNTRWEGKKCGVREELRVNMWSISLGRDGAITTLSINLGQSQNP